MQKFALLDILFGYIRVKQTADGLVLQSFQKDSQPLYAVTSGGLFRLADRLEPSHVFFIDSDGVKNMGRGTQSYRFMPAWQLFLGWASLGLGALGLAWLLLSGVVRTLLRKWDGRHPVLIPFIGILAMALPVPLFQMQSFLAIGDITMASVLLMIFSASLPLAMGVGVWQSLQNRPMRPLGGLELAAMLSVLQSSLLLAYWGLLPLRLWV